MGAIEGLKLLRKLDDRLKRMKVHFIGIVAKETDLGTELSEEVRAGLQKVVELAEKLAK